MRPTIFEYLTESQNYAELFNPLGGVCDNNSLYKIRDEINWAKTTLKRQDRIMWYLRLYRASLISQWIGNWPEQLRNVDHKTMAEYEKAKKDAFGKVSAIYRKTCADYGVDHFWFSRNQGLPYVKAQLAHAMGIATNAPKLNSYIFDKQGVNTLILDLRDLESEWIASRNQELDYNGPNGDEEHTHLIDFPDGWTWFNLNKPSCPHEGNAMGHCGNEYDNTDGDQVLSLRKKLANGRWRPSLTFILDKDGYLGEMKGRANEKPKPQYHPYIVALLKLPIIKGIKGGGYDAGNNFSINDLPYRERAALFEQKPKLMPLDEYFNSHGLDEFVRERVAKLLPPHHDTDNLPSFEGDQFVLEKWDDWKDFLRCNGDASVDRLLGMLNGDVELNNRRRQDGWLSDMVSHFPVAYQKLICEYAVANGLEADEDSDWDHSGYRYDLYADLEKEEQPENLYDVLRLSNSIGEETGTDNKIVAALQDACQLDAVDGGDINLDVEPRPDGKYYLWVHARTICDWLGNPRSVILKADEWDSSGSLWEEPPHVDLDDGFYGFSHDAAFEYFVQNKPDGIKIEVPPMKAIDKMTLDEIKDELCQLRDTTRDHLAAYYGNNDRVSYAHALRQTRNRYWGISPTPTLDDTIKN